MNFGELVVGLNEELEKGPSGNILDSEMITVQTDVVFISLISRPITITLGKDSLH